MNPWLPEIVLFAASIVALLCSPLDRPAEQVPEDFLIRLQSVQNISQFLNSWVDQSAVQRAYLFEADDGDLELEIAHPASCIPEMQVVEFERPYDPSLVVWPICTRVRRCGGCCSSSLLHCVPTRTSILTLKVIKARYPHPGADTLQLEGYDTIQIEQHDKCACQCVEEERDCTPLQRYHPGQCQCICRNREEATRCKQPESYWDSKDCTCRCRQVSDCSTGSFFNNKSCRCERTKEIPPIPINFPGPEEHMGTVLRDDGGENDAYRLRYSEMESHRHAAPIAMAQYQQSNGGLLLDNATQHQSSED